MFNQIYIIMKKLLLFIAVMFCNICYAQLNMMGSELRENLESRSQYSMDEIISKLIIYNNDVSPVSYWGVNHKSWLELNEYSGRRVYVHHFESEYSSATNNLLCVNRADSTVQFKPLELNKTYTFNGTIRFKDQAEIHEEMLNQMRYLPEGGEIPSIWLDALKDVWPTSDFVDKHIIKTSYIGGRPAEQVSHNMFYLLSNDKNETYYIPYVVPREYEKQPSIWDYKMFDVAYYEQLSKLKGLDVAIVTQGSIPYGVKDEDFIYMVKDYVTQKPIDLTKLLTRDFDLWHYNPSEGRKFEYAKCIDVYTNVNSEERNIDVVGLFDYNGFRFTIQFAAVQLDGNYQSGKSYDMYLTYHKAPGGSKIYIISKTSLDDCANIVKMNKEQKEAERKRQEAEYAKYKAERRSELISKYGEKYGNLVNDHKLEIGMTKEMCKDAMIFPPSDICTKTTAFGNVSIWFYTYSQLHFSGDKLVKVVTYSF